LDKKLKATLASLQVAVGNLILRQRRKALVEHGRDTIDVSDGAMVIMAAVHTLGFLCKSLE
jgi:hypothetical protein